ncbi:hypothetical protein FRB95_010743 [Tulasnella sp. JGI-2019a]|nr:hypothetical protein FRB95_010743 [Tulasnella sp. JGI-2019a]
MDGQPPPTGPYPPFYLGPPNLDPAIAALYQPQHQQHQHQQHLHSPHGHPQQQHMAMLPPPHPSATPESTAESPHHHGGMSDTGGSSKAAGKRPVNHGDDSPRKKSKQEFEKEDSSEKEDKDGKPKATRGSRACTVCRRLKMKCVGAENGPPCKRCETGGHECIFEESNRGKRSTKKSEAMQRSLSKMEKTLDVVLRSLGNPALQNLAETIQQQSSDHSPSPTTANIVQPPLPSHLVTNLTSNSNSATNLIAHSPSSYGHGQDNHAQGGMGPPMRRSESSGHHQGSQLASGSLGSRSLHQPTSPKLDSLPDSTLNPLGLLADTSLAHRREKQSQGGPTEDDHLRSMLPTGQFVEEEDPSKVGLANERYFKPGPVNILPLRRMYIERQIQPEMLTFVPKEEVLELFAIFFDHMNMHVAVLDPAWHTPSLVCSRSPFLLTAICAVSSKFHNTARIEVHQRLNKIARKLAFGVLEQGFKSVEVVQAYIILALWGVGPVERYEQERTWVMLGMALRVATDLNMHRKIPEVPDEVPDAQAQNRELRNRERTWMLCYALDRSLSSQTGKPHSVNEDYIIRDASRWWQNPSALPMDIGLAAYVDYQRTLSRALDFLYSGTNTPTGLQTDCDYLTVVKGVESQLSSWLEGWNFHNSPSDHGNNHRIITYRHYISQFYFLYANLLVNSFGLQNALERAPVDLAHFFARCYSSATNFIKIVKELAPQGYLRYAPDSHFVFISYGVLTLLKLIRPEFRAFMEDEKKIIQGVNDVADLLESVAVNPYHTPALYSTFLRALVSSKTGASQAPSPRMAFKDDPMSDGDVRPSNELQVQDLGMNNNQNGNGPQQLSGRSGSPMRENTFNAWQHFAGETGQAQVQDMTTFPPTFAPAPSDQNHDLNMFSMDNILGNGFWDSVLIPGYSNSFEGLSGGFAYGPGGSGFITPKVNSPVNSGANSPGRAHSMAFPQQPNMHAPFES